MIRILFVAVLACLVAGGCGGRAEDPEATLLARARAAYVGGEYLAAEELYQAYLQTYPEGRSRVEAWNRLFEVARNVVKDNEKAAKLTEAMVLDGAFGPAELAAVHERAAELAAIMKDFEKALSLWNQYLALEAPDAEKRRAALAEKARLLTLLGRAEEALLELDRCAELAGAAQAQARCRFERGLLRLRLERTAEARKDFESVRDDAQAATGLRAQAAFSLAEMLEAEGRKKEAAALYESILETYPNPKAVRLRIEHLR